MLHGSILFARFWAKKLLRNFLPKIFTTNKSKITQTTIQIIQMIQMIQPTQITQITQITQPTQKIITIMPKPN